MMGKISKNQMGAIEMCELINALLASLLEDHVKVIDGDNPKDGYLDCISYDQQKDEFYFWTKNL